MTRYFGHISGIILTNLVVAGCGHVAFSPHFPDNDPLVVQQQISVVKVSKNAPMNETGKPLAFFVTPKKIVAYDLDGQKLVWEKEDVPKSRIVVGRSSIFYCGKSGNLVARDVKDGELVWETKMYEGRLLGLTTDGLDVFYSVEHPGKSGAFHTAGHLIAVKGSSGRTKWKRPSNGRIGAPAARDGLVFVPLRYQALAILDSAKGHEKARIRSKEETILWVRATNLGILFGGKSGVYKLDPKAASGTKQGSNFVSVDLPESVRPVYWWDGYNAALSGYTAYDRNRLLWQIGPNQRFKNATIFVHNYRFLGHYSNQCL